MNIAPLASSEAPLMYAASSEAKGDYTSCVLGRPRAADRYLGASSAIRSVEVLRVSIPARIGPGQTALTRMRLAVLKGLNGAAGYPVPADQQRVAVR